CTRDRHQYRSDKCELIFADPVRQIAGERPAEQRAQIHQSSYKAHDRGGCADAFRKSCDQRRHKHGAGHIEKAGGKHQDDVFRIEFLFHDGLSLLLCHTILLPLTRRIYTLKMPENSSLPPSYTRYFEKTRRPAQYSSLYRPPSVLFCCQSL